MGIEGEGPKIIAMFVAALLIAYFLNKNYHSGFIIATNDNLTRLLAIILLVIGILFWLWSVTLLLINFPKGRLIKSGPYVAFLHPLYNSFSFLILPALALYMNSWIYFIAPLVLFLGTITFGKNEEIYLSETFGSEYANYRKKVWFKF
jgi:protein-S-isoprenylcysteine O-methyltransferase Ste14